MIFQNEKKLQLLDFLDKKLFNPIMEALPEQYSSDREQSLLKIVKEQTLLEIEQFHRKEITPEEVHEMFLHKLYEENASNLGKEREDLELPRFIEIREQFECLYNNQE